MLPIDPKRNLNGSEPENGASRPSLPASAVEAAPPAPQALNAPPSLTGLLRAGRHRWPAMLGLGLLGAAVAGAAAWLIYPGKYNVQALLHVASHGSRGYESEADFLNFQRTQMALLKGQGVLRAALAKPEVAELREVRSQTDPVAWLQKGLVTDTLLGPEVLRVTLAGDKPEDLPVLLNEIVQAYLRDYGAKEEDRTATRTKQLRENYRRCAENLRDKRQRMRSREQQLGLDDPQIVQARYQMALQQLAAAQNQRLQIQLERQKAHEEHLAQQALLRTPESVPVSKAAVEDELRQEPAVRKQLERLAAAEEALQRYRSLSSPAAREALLQGPRAERDAVQQALDVVRGELRPGIEIRLKAKAIDDLKASAARLEGQVKLLQGQEQTLDTAVKKLEVQVEGLRFGRGGPERTASDVEAMRDEVTQTELVLKKIGDELGTLAAEPPPAARITLLEAAEVPISRNMDRQLKVIGGASFSVCGLIVLGIALLEFRARRVHGVADVAQGLGLTVVGTLPPAKPDVRIPSSVSLSDIDLGDTVPEAADAFRAVFLHAAREEGLRVVMVTSAVGDEEKTSLAAQLAASLARAWRRTLLIDCDLRNPKAHAALGVPLEPGFSDALRDRIKFEDAIRTTHISRLWLMPAGRGDRQALQALAREDLAAVFERLKQHYDFIVIDAAPVLLAADAALIGKHADGALLAVMRDVSRMPAVHAARCRLTALGVRVLGAVVLGEKSDSSNPYAAFAAPVLN